MARHILITGGTGFIGRALCKVLLTRGDQLTVLSRQSTDSVRQTCGDVRRIQRFEDIDRPVDAIINLAGEPIADRPWTSRRRALLRTSRIDLTESLILYLKTQRWRPEVLISGSAVGFYGDQQDRLVDETTPPHHEFTHQLCADWEAAALQARNLGIRTCLSRTGLVLGPHGGFLKRLLPAFRLGLGGRLGDGKQFMPWIHLDDMVAALCWMLDTPAASGAYNVTAPHPVTNLEFTTTLAAALRRPALAPVPGWLLRPALGDMSTLLLTGQQAVPSRLLAEGFSFRHATLKEALPSVLRS